MKNTKVFRLSFLLTVMLLGLFVSPARATDYVFVFNGTYLANDNGTISAVTTFDPNTCIWTCYNSDGTEGTLDGSTGRALKNGNYYMKGSTSDGTAVTASTTADNNWRINSSYVTYNGTSFYLYYNGGWKTSSKTSKGSASSDAYASNNGKYDARPTYIASNSTTAVDKTVAPTISVAGLSGNAGIAFEHTALSGTYQPSVSNITVGSTSYYRWSNGTWNTTQEPFTGLNPTYTWDVQSGSASITSDGVLTLSNNNNQTVTIKITATNTSPSITKSSTLTVTATYVDVEYEESVTQMTVSPDRQMVDLGDVKTFAASNQIYKSSQTYPAYVRIVTDGNTFYKWISDNRYYGETPAMIETTGDPVAFKSFSWTLTGDNGYIASVTPATSSESNTTTVTRSTKITSQQRLLTLTVNAVYQNAGDVAYNRSAAATIVIPYTMVDLTELAAIEGDAVSLNIGETGSVVGHFTYKPDTDEGGLPYRRYTYSSNDDDIATVSADGTITAVSPGTTSITVQSIKMDGTTNTDVSCEVAVNVSIVAPTISIAANGAVTITDNNVSGSGATLAYTIDELYI